MSETENNLNTIEKVETLTEQCWTDHSLEAYGKLSLPSLYEFLLMQEKLAVEIRKQNKELRLHCERISQLAQNTDRLSDKITDLSDKFDDAACESTETTSDSNSSAESLDALISMMDTSMQLMQSSKKCFDTILDTIPEKTGFLFPSKPQWRQQLEEIIDGYIKGLSTVLIKLESALEEARVILINPKPGCEFDPCIHKAVETIKGNSKLSVASVVRCGYEFENELLRPAEVVITS